MPDFSRSFPIFRTVSKLSGLFQIISHFPYIFTTFRIFPYYFPFSEWCKGTYQKRFSGIRPLRGGGYPPFPLRKKTFFFSHWFSVKGGVGVPPNSAKEKNLLFRSKNSIFCLFFYAFLALFGPLYGLFGPFLTLFNEKNIIFSPFRKKFPGKA